MSQAIIDFCEGLKTALLEIEERLSKAKATLDQGTVAVTGEAAEQVGEAANLLSAFRVRAGQMAESIRAELPGRAEPLAEKLKQFSEEAQVALRHAAVFLAETASKGAESAANALHNGSHQARALAQKMRHATAVSTSETPPA